MILGTVHDQSSKTTAEKFITEKNFHQILRNEIVFGLIPKSLTPNADQTHPLLHLMVSLKETSLLWNVQGMLRLPTVCKFFEIIKENPKFKFKKKSIKDCVNSK